MSTKTTRVYTCTLAMCLGTQEKYSLTHSLLYIYSFTAPHLLTHCSTSTHSLLHIYSLTHCSTSHLIGEYFGFLFAVICTSSPLQLPSSSFSLNSCSPSSQNSSFPPAAARVCLFLFLRSSSSEDGGVRPSKWPTSSLLSCLRDLMG